MQILLNGRPHELASELSVYELLKSLELEPKEVVIERNLKVLNKDLYKGTIIKADDRLEIVRFVGGG
jgi:thiamine biosynthesis protein ThiS